MRQLTRRCESKEKIMPKVGVVPIRRASLIQATIAEIGDQGSLEVTVSQIAKRAGMSSALAHHYFGSKEAMFLAAMRHVMTVYGAEVRGALSTADTPRDRVKAVVRASFAPASFRREVVAAWLNFYVLAQTQPDARRLLSIYRRRLVSNLTHGLRPDLGAGAAEVAQTVAALIDGAYLYAALGTATPNAAIQVRRIEAYLSAVLPRF